MKPLVRPFTPPVLGPAKQGEGPGGPQGKPGA